MLPDPAPAFRALSDPTRREILSLLMGDEMTIAQVADQFDMTRPAVKKHLSRLADAQLISVEPRGRERINRLNPEGFRAVSTWLDLFDRYWDEKLTKLKDTIERDTAK